MASSKQASSKIGDSSQLQTYSSSQGFMYNFAVLVDEKMSSLMRNIFGDYKYERKNRFNVKGKIKMLQYLRQKYLFVWSNAEEHQKKKFYNYDSNFFERKADSLDVMKQMLLQGKSQVQAAEDTLQRLKKTKDFYKAQFLNEAAYQFDRQRYCSIFWGFMGGCLINSTIYRKGRLARQTALLVTIAHVFGQISYHINLDKYFDSVYMIFEQQAEAFVKQEEKELKKAEKTWIKNKIE